MQEKKKVNAKREAEEAKVNESIRRKGGIDQVPLPPSSLPPPSLHSRPTWTLADQSEQ